MTSAVIIGAGAGLSASLARAFHQRGHRIVLASRDPSDLTDLQRETNAELISCDARYPAQIEAVFAAADTMGETPEIAVYNPSARVPGAIEDVDPEAVQSALMTTAYGGFIMAQQAARRMVPRGKGAILFTGASASIKGYPGSAAFAMAVSGTPSAVGLSSRLTPSPASR